MKKRTVIPAALLLLCSLAWASQQKQTPQARAYVVQAVETMGGEQALRSIHTAKMEYRGHWFMLEQSERPEPPFLVSYETNTEYRDYAKNRVRQETDGWNPGAPEGVKMNLTVAGGVAQASLGERKFPMSMGQVEDAYEWMTFAPDRILLHALKNNDLRTEPDITYHAVPHHVVVMVHEGIPVRMYFNAWTHLLSSVEWVHAHPYDNFWRVWGDVTHRYEFTFYTLLPTGVRLPMQWDLSRNGQPYHSITIARYEINPQISEEMFAIAPEVKTAFEQRKPMMAAGPPFGKASPLVEGDESLVQFVGAWNSAIFKQPDGLVLLEAPIGPEYVKALLAEAKKRYPNTPIKAMITTSDAWPHFAGIREMVANGVPAYATDLNKPILTRAVNAKFTQHPDTLAQKPKAAKFTWVSGKTLIGSGPNRLELYPIRNPSGERMMMVYMPERKLLYVSDLAQRTRDGSFFMPEYLVEIRDAVKRENLTVDKFFAMHMTLTPWSELEDGIAKAVKPAEVK